VVGKPDRGQMRFDRAGANQHVACGRGVGIVGHGVTSFAVSRRPSRSLEVFLRDAKQKESTPGVESLSGGVSLG